MDHSAIAAIQAVVGVDALEALDVDVIAACHVQTLVAGREAAQALADWLTYTSQQAPLNPPLPSVLIRRLADEGF